MNIKSTLFLASYPSITKHKKFMLTWTATYAELRPYKKGTKTKLRIDTIFTILVVSVSPLEITSVFQRGKRKVLRNILINK